MFEVLLKHKEKHCTVSENKNLREIHSAVTVYCLENLLGYLQWNLFMKINICQEELKYLTLDLLHKLLGLVVLATMQVIFFC